MVAKFPDGKRPFDVAGTRFVPCPAETLGKTCVECRLCLDVDLHAKNLGIAFNSTFVGLMLCIVLMYVLHMVQSQQEAFIIETQRFCRDKLVEVMKVPTPHREKQSTTIAIFASKFTD